MRSTDVDADIGGPGATDRREHEKNTDRRAAAGASPSAPGGETEVEV